MYNNNNNRHAPGGSGAGGSKLSVVEACDRIKEEFNMMHVQLQNARHEAEKGVADRTNIQQQALTYYEMSSQLNFELNKQAEIAKRLAAIIQQVLPLLPQGQQEQVNQAVDRARQVSMIELQQILGQQHQLAGQQQLMNSLPPGSMGQQHNAQAAFAAAMMNMPQSSMAQFTGNPMAAMAMHGMGAGNFPAAAAPFMASMAAAAGGPKPEHNHDKHEPDTNGERLPSRSSVNASRTSTSVGRAESHTPELKRAKTEIDSDDAKSNADDLEIDVEQNDDAHSPTANGDKTPSESAAAAVAKGLDLAKHVHNKGRDSPHSNASSGEASTPGTQHHKRVSEKQGTPLNKGTPGNSGTTTPTSALSNKPLRPPAQPMMPFGAFPGMQGMMGMPGMPNMSNPFVRAGMPPFPGGADAVRLASLAAAQGGMVPPAFAPAAVPPQVPSTEKAAYSFKMTGEGNLQAVQFPSDAMNAPGVPRGMKVLHTLDHGDVVCAVVISQQSRQVYTGGKGCVKVWDIQAANGPKELHTLQCSNEDYIRSCKLLRDNSALIVGGETKMITMFDLGNGNPTIKCELDCESAACYALAISQDNKYCFSCGADGNILVWDLHNKQKICTLEGHTDGSSCIDIMPDGQLWSGSLDNTVRQWDWTERRETKRLDLHAQIFSLGCCPTGDWVAIGLDSCKVEVRHATEPDIYMLHAHEQAVLSLTFAQSGKWFVSTGKENNVYAWRTPYGAQLFSATEPCSVLSCDISSDDKYVATGSGDRKATVYEVQY